MIMACVSRWIYKYIYIYMYISCTHFKKCRADSFTSLNTQAANADRDLCCQLVPNW